MTLLNRFIFFEMPLVVEENITATRSLGRSWVLTKGYIRRIFVILLVATLVALPVGVILYIFSEIFYDIFKILYEIFRLKPPIFSGSKIDSSLEIVFDILITATILILPFCMTLGLISAPVGVMLDIELNNPTSLLLLLVFYYVIFL
ncbi:hypothetical protein [Okeania sp. KiyG1]|uniref:hypothetical protein n=1 Tax=Okeania sp. KiyG1 TaxID=2720165 RepID=UPI0019207DB5|nr:hypothetical protein [Okeania sp. KiyG1]GFZ94090.1 hypothetical protein CYANOKiyG1_04760 [Okeania sp. KiyG1]